MIQRSDPFAHAVRMVISVSSVMFVPVSFRSLSGCDAVSVRTSSCAGFPISCLGRFPWFLLGRYGVLLSRSRFVKARRDWGFETALWNVAGWFVTVSY